MVSEQLVGFGFVAAALLILLFLPGLVFTENSGGTPENNFETNTPGLSDQATVQNDSFSEVNSPGLIESNPPFERPSAPSASPLPVRRISIEEASAEGYSFCGDSVCDASESCSSCTNDCGCTSSEFCGSSGVCQAKEFVGDGVCTPKEKKQGVCVDCGCTAGSLCNFYSNECIAPAKLTQAKAKSIVDSYLKQNPSHTLAGISDTYFGEVAVKEISFDCSKSYYCRVDLLVNSTGAIIETLKTT